MHLYTTPSLNLNDTLYLYEVWQNGQVEYTPDFDPMFKRTLEDGPTISQVLEDLTDQAKGTPMHVFLTNSYEDLLDEVMARYPKDKATLSVSWEAYDLINKATGNVDVLNREVHLVGATNMPTRVEIDLVQERLGTLCDELDAKALIVYLYEATQGRGVLPEDVSADLYTPEVAAIRAELED